MNRIKLIAMDLDGTLTQHKSKMTEEVREILNILAKDYALVIVGAGSCERIYRQMNEYPIDIIGQYGMQWSQIDQKTGEFKLIKNEKYKVNKTKTTKKINKLREITAYKEFAGDTVEFHPSGIVTFPLLGTEADLETKLSFDSDRKKRREVLEIVKKEFNDPEESTVFIGGTSSFDIAPAGYNKYAALVSYIEGLGIKKEETIYFGDDYGPGGNDEHLYKSDIKFIKIDDYREFDLDKIYKVMSSDIYDK